VRWIEGLPAAIALAPATSTVLHSAVHIGKVGV
jgi:hypothetical protein